jgi:type VI secretion system protein ImpA
MALLADIYPDLKSLLAPIAGASPTGVDLDGTLELSALELASAEPEDAVVPGVERSDGRNWREIREQTQALLDKSKDLRILARLVRALLQIEGLPGYCAGVSVMCELAERYWDDIYPALDPEDGDAVMRLNAIQELVSAPFMAQLRVAPMLGGDRSVKATANDLLLATSSALGKPELPHAPSHLVFGVLDALAPTTLQEHVDLLAATRGRLSRLIEFVFEKTRAKLQIGALIKIDAKAAPGLLDGLHQSLSDEATRLLKNKASETATGTENGDSRLRGGGSGEVSRREDVIMMIERICGYYARVEPSSPVPLILQRAKRLVTMDFLQIVRDLADQGLPQVGTVAGIAIPGLGATQRDDEAY